MGMRAQILIKDTGVYLYTHWGSAELPQILQKALDSEAGRRRWRDPEYLTRIIFETLLDTSYNRELGYGIGTMPHTDTEYAPLVVDCKKQQVRIGATTMSFADYCTAEVSDKMAITEDFDYEY